MDVKFSEGDTPQTSRNPRLYCLAIQLPPQVPEPPETVKHRKEVWKSRRWIEHLGSNAGVELTRRERFGLYRDVCRDSCWVICCPPCSATGIANKLAFSAPRKTTYWPLILPTSSGSPDDHCVVATVDFSATFKVFWIRTIRKTRICCTYLKSTVSKGLVILYSHSNADDLGTVLHHLRNISKLFFCDVFAYDYSGYGLSEGEPSLLNFYADSEAAYLALRCFYGFNPDEIILYGASLGTVAAAHLAAKFSSRGVIMMASVSSGLRLLAQSGALPFRHREKSYPFDLMDNIGLAAKIRSPVLVIHGEDDQLCSVQGAKELVRRLPFAAEPAFFRGVGHDESALVRLAHLRINGFIHSESAVILRSIYEA